MEPGDYFITKKGSVYTYLEDGRTQRFKKATNELLTPQDAIVFVPNYEWFLENVKADIVPILGEDELQMEQILLSYVQGRGKKNYIFDKNFKALKNNLEIAATRGPILLTFGDEKQTDFYLPVAKDPRIGFNPFDTRKYQLPSGQWMRERHLGNKVIQINHK